MVIYCVCNYCADVGTNLIKGLLVNLLRFIFAKSLRETATQGQADTIPATLLFRVGLWASYDLFNSKWVTV
jgi:hypothetical protein